MVRQIWQVAQQAVVYSQGFTDCVVYRCSTTFYVAAIPSQTFRRGGSYYCINNFVEVQLYIRTLKPVTGTDMKMIDVVVAVMYDNLVDLL